MKDLQIKILQLSIKILSIRLARLRANFMQTENGQKVYEMAKSLLGKRVAPYNASTDYGTLGCASTVNIVVYRAIGKPIGGDTSTHSMYDFLQDSSRFLKVSASLAGDICISPSGYGNGTMSNGHVGIVGLHGILSNNSEDGRLEEKLTLETWKKIYVDIGGYPMEFYRII